MHGSFALKWAASTLLACLVITVVCAQEDHPTEGTRQLYLLGTSHKDPLPPVTPSAIASTAPKNTVAHLGLRYNLVLIDNATRQRQPVPAEGALHAGDCFAIDLQSNRSGYVYVFAQQSSGTWVPLLPSPEMPGESNVLDPGKRVQVPRDYCFVVKNPPGEETLFVILSRDPRDFYELFESYKTRSPQAGTLQIADGGRLNSAIEHIDERYGSTRDIAITKIDEPRDKADERGSVYVVNTSNKPSSSIVTKIVIRHR